MCWDGGSCLPSPSRPDSVTLTTGGLQDKETLHLQAQRTAVLHASWSSPAHCRALCVLHGRLEPMLGHPRPDASPWPSRRKRGRHKTGYKHQFSCSGPAVGHHSSLLNSCLDKQGGFKTRAGSSGAPRWRYAGSLVAVKLGCLLGLLLLPLLCGLLPVRLRGAGTRGRWRSFVGCVAGGIFLAACLLDVVPDSLSDIREELRSQRITVDFPFPEFVLALGFLMVLIIEHLVLDCSEQCAGEASPLLSCGEATPQPAGTGEWVVETGAPHLPADFRAHSSFRSFVLFLSLSVHSLFEGLAVGLQDTESKVLQICIAILVHKSVIAVSLSLLLLQSQVPTRRFVALIGTFAIMSPLGIAVGIVMMQNPSTMAQCLLEGIAAGTFVYITFLEILPHDLSSPTCRLPKVLSMLLGFSVMAALRFLG
ncbi:zinc transporter ZIP1-like [Pangshura tecta]